MTRMLRLISVACLVVLLGAAAAQAAPAWVVTWPGNYDEFGRAMVVRPSGNIFSFGERMSGGTDLNFIVGKLDWYGTELWTPALRVTQLSGADHVMAATQLSYSLDVVAVGYTEQVGGTYALVVDRAAGGGLMWTQQYGTAGSVAQNVAKDSSDYIYTAGWEPGGGGIDVPVLRKINPSTGAEIWSRTPTGCERWSSGIKAFVGVDGSDYIYLAGTVCEPPYGPNDGQHMDGFVVKYDTNGNLVTGPERSLQEPINAFAVDSSGNCYATGNFFTRKWDSGLNVAWTTVHSMSDFLLGKALTVRSGNVYVACYAQLSTKCNTLVFNSSGTLVSNWEYDPGDDLAAEPTCIAIDSYSRIVVAGKQTTALGDWDLFCIRWDSGTRDLTETYGGSGDDSATAIGVDNADDVDVLGYVYSGATGYDMVTLQYAP